MRIGFKHIVCVLMALLCTIECIAHEFDDVCNTSNQIYRSVVMTDNTVFAKGAAGPNLHWTLTDDGIFTVSGEGVMYNCSNNSAPWGKLLYMIKTVIIEEGVTSIGTDAFRNCNNLSSVSLSNSITYIGDNAFISTALSSIEIPKGVNDIGKKPFSSGLKSILVSSDNTKYDSRDNCNAIVETNSNTLLCGCVNTIIPNTITAIGDDAFRGCSSIKTLEMPHNLKSIGERAFSSCSGLTSIDIPNGVTSIGEYAFSDCSSLTSIDIPYSVTSIGKYAFWGCTNLTLVKNGIVSPFDIEDNVFNGISSEAVLQVPNGTKSEYLIFRGWANHFKEVIEEELNNSSIIIFDDSIVKEICINNWDTDGDRELSMEEVAKIESIGTVFSETKIETFNELRFFYGLTSMPDNAFARCSNLVSIKIPVNVTNIGQYAFMECNNLTSIFIPSNVNSINSEAFFDCEKLSFINVDKGNEVFDSRDNCNGIIHTASNTLICGCKNTLIPNSVSSIGNRAFAGSYLSSIVIPKNVISIGDLAFSNCWHLTSIDFSSNLMEIGKGAFQQCFKLTTIELPNSLAKIGEYAFYMSALKEVKSNILSPFPIPNTVFEKISSKAILQVPKGTITSYKALSGWTSFFNEVVEEDANYSLFNLIVYSTGNGSTVYNGNTIRNTNNTFIVKEGSSIDLILSPDVGYRVVSVLFNGKDVTSNVSNNIYTINNIASNISLEIVYERIAFSLTVTASGNGTAAYNNTQVRGKSSSFTIVEGVDAIVTFTPDAGNRLKSVKLNGKDITADIVNLQYTITGINANTTLEVVFEAIPIYTINIVVAGNGSMTCGNTVLRNQSREFSVQEGNTVNAKLIPDNGYRLASVLVNGENVIDLVENNQLTIENVSTNMAIEVTFEAIPVTTYTLTIKSSGYGTATYEGTEIRNKTSTFTIAEGTTVVVAIAPDEGYRLKSMKHDDEDVMSSVKNSLYSFIMEANVVLEAMFEEYITEFSIDNMNYNIISYSDRTARLVSGNIGTTLTVPATCTALNTTWTIIGVETNALANCTDLAAIIWNPEVQFNGNIKNPNLLLYVKDKKYAPTTVRNVVVDNVAEEITLSDAESGNPFYCPKAFTAQRIIYEHNYSMTSGYQTCQGWETLALPFNVTTIQRQNGTEIVPRETWVQGSNKLPFWLYTLTELGWRPETTIAANTPYIISMPNNENYNSKYNISGVIQFIGTNVEVKASDNMPVEKNGNKTFVPNYQYLPASESMYALNVNNQWCTNTTTEAEGSVFVKNSRPVHPFEAYLTVSGADAAKRAIPIFDDDLPADIKNLTPSLSQDEEAIYDLTGRKMQGELHQGVYIINGKKVMVK